MAVGTEAAPEAEELCVRDRPRVPRAIFFAGKLVFEEERWYQRLLHNETAYEIQRRLQFRGLNAIIVPVRVFKPRPGARRGRRGRAQARRSQPSSTSRAMSRAYGSGDPWAMRSSSRRPSTPNSRSA